MRKKTIRRLKLEHFKEEWGMNCVMYHSKSDKKIGKIFI